MMLMLIMNSAAENDETLGWGYLLIITSSGR